MRFNELYSVLHKVPFSPFRIQLTNGQSHVIPHPDFAMLKRTSVVIGLSSFQDNIHDDHIECDLLHVVAIEPSNGASATNGPRRKKRRK